MKSCFISLKTIGIGGIYSFSDSGFCSVESTSLIINPISLYSFIVIGERLLTKAILFIKLLK